MKRTKHITINLTDEEYIQLAKLAENDRRKLADFCALVLLDSTQAQRAEAFRVGSGSFVPSKWKN